MHKSKALKSEGRTNEQLLKQSAKLNTQSINLYILDFDNSYLSHRIINGFPRI